MKRYIGLLWLFLFLYYFLGSSACAQYRSSDFDWQDYYIEVESILNLIINSQEFNEGYGTGELIFVENIELKLLSTIKLYRKGVEVVIKKDEPKDGDYAFLDDFMMATKNPTHARVMISFPNRHEYMGFTLDKKNGNWVITNNVLLPD